MPRKVKDIAQDILNDWIVPNDYAAPYLSAMLKIENIEDNYGLDSAQSVVLYFLSNASSWKGEKAREIKKELKALAS